MLDDYQNILSRAQVEQSENWPESFDQTKDLRIFLPEDFYICVIPPFLGAKVRFTIGHKDTTEKVSVYYDDRNALGHMPRGYYEAYLLTPRDCVRYYPEEFDKMISDIIQDIRDFISTTQP